MSGMMRKCDWLRWLHRAESLHPYASGSLMHLVGMLVGVVVDSCGYRILCVRMVS